MQEILKKVGSKHDCSIAVFIQDKKVLAGFRDYVADGKGDKSYWTFPGGRCDENETIEETLRREVKEEIGIKKFEILQCLGEMKGACEGDTIYLFLCETYEESKNMEPEKFLEWKWFSLEDFPEDFINEPVRDLLVKTGLL